jgi:hypothetical protein
METKKYEEYKMSAKREQKLIKKLRRMQKFLNEVINRIAQGIDDEISKEFYLSSFENIEVLSSEIQESFIVEGLINEEIDLNEFLDGMFKRNSRKQNRKKNDRKMKESFLEDKNFEEFEHFTRPYAKNRPNSRRLQSPTFRKLNKLFNFKEDWVSKPTEGYLNEDFLSLDDKYIKASFPDFDRKNPETFPPKARWIDYADKYSKEYLLDLDSPWCFRSALQCFELTISSKEFEYELRKMEKVGPEAVELFIEYCTQLGVIEITDKDIDYLKKLVGKGDKNG